jgi:hypothetical protein
MKHGYSPAWLKRHISDLIREGYPRAQAVAIAMNEARNVWRSIHPRAKFPPHLAEKSASRNPRESMSTMIQSAARLSEDFSGHEARSLGKVTVPELPRVAIVIGEVEGVIYNTVRDGKFERYIHKFRAKSRPLLCVSHDGKQLLLIGGHYDFTEAGIVDGA